MTHSDEPQPGDLLSVNLMEKMETWKRQSPKWHKPKARTEQTRAAASPVLHRPWTPAAKPRKLLSTSSSTKTGRLASLKEIIHFLTKTKSI